MQNREMIQMVLKKTITKTISMTYYFNIWHSKYECNVKSNNKLSKGNKLFRFLRLGVYKIQSTNSVQSTLIMLIIILVHAQNAKKLPHLAKQ